MRYIQRVIMAAVWAAIAWVVGLGHFMKSYLWLVFIEGIVGKDERIAMQAEAMGPVIVWAATATAFLCFALGCFGKLPGTRKSAPID